MATKSISQLDTQATANETDLFEVAIVDANSASGYASKKESAAAIADAIVGEYQYPLRITGTTAKTIAGAINELKNLVDLLPQFAIEVVSSLPVSDISETTIYLVPAQDPEQGNYYEEYIYVNNAWELVGTTAVDLSGYYTSAQVDTLLAAKANTSSLATVATSGAYADLSGKPTIDTALDTTSTNAVENRAVASEINSIKSDITVDGSASGDIVSFGDGSDNPLKELKISIEAVQIGSGDPSPTNVRPISGWNSVGLVRTGKNLVDIADRTITSQYTSEYFTLKKGTNTVSLFVKNNTTIVGTCYLRNRDNANVALIRISASMSSRISASFTLTDDTDLRLVISGSSSGYSYDISQVQIEIGSTATAYEQYNGATINISWQDEAGTVYGGTLDVKTGVLTVTYAMIDLGELEYTYKATGYNSKPFLAILPNAKLGATSATIVKAYCTCFKQVAANALNSASIDKVFAIHHYFSSYHELNIIDTDYTDTTSLKTAMQGQKLAYELATPVTYQLTPTEIRSLLGVNNVWADCGSITELKYTRDLNLCINDIIARIEALEGANSNRSLSLSPTLTKSIVSDSDTAEGKTEETEEETKEEAQNER